MLKRDNRNHTGEFWLGAAIIIVLALLLSDEPIVAQQANQNPAIVVAACGAAPSPYPSAGQRAPMVVDVNGNLCSGVSVSATVATTGLAISVNVGVSTAGVPITPAGGMASTSAPSWSSGTVVPFSFETDGDLRVAASVTPAADQTVSTTNSKGSGAVAVVGAASDGATTLGGPVVIAGISGTTVQTLEMNNQTPAGTEYGVITRNIPSGTQTVSGTVTVTDGAGSLNTIVDSGTITAQNTAYGALSVVLQSTTGTTPIGTMTVTSGVATGASVSTVQPVYVGGNGTGALFPIITCDSTAIVNLTSNGTTQLVALTANQRIYVCSYAFFAAGTVSVQLEDGTTAGAGTGCTAGTSAVSMSYPFTAQTGVARGSGLGMIAKTNLSAALCARTNATTAVGVEVAYTKFGLHWLSVLALILYRRRRCL